MKKVLKSTLSLVLCLLLAAPWTLLSPVFAAETITLLPGQKILSLTELDVPTVPDGKIKETEYGSVEPTLRLTAGNGFWAEDTEGNKLTENLPEYVDLYLARKDDLVFIGLAVKETVHESQEYLLDAFLGFGDDTNAYTMLSGNTSSFAMTKKTRAKYLKEWMDFAPTALSGKSVSENGTETETTPLYNKLVEYPLVQWGNVVADENGGCISIYEIELSIKDSVIGSGKEYTEVPEIGYFGFDLALYDGKERCGTLHFNTDLTGEENAPKSAPHVLDLAGNVEVDPNSKIADLSALSIERGVITPTFDANTYDYSITMPYGYAIKVNAEAKAAEAGAKVEIFGAEALGKDGDGVVTVICTAASGYRKTYKINVKRDYIQSEFSAEGTDGLNALLTQFRDMEWSAADSVVIKLSGTVDSSDSILLGQETFFNELGTKLPIVIDGNGEAVINLAGEKIVSANDITFRNLKMNAGAAEIYAGAGKLVFENVEFDENQTASFFADTYSMAPFAGWKTENLVKSLNNKLLDTSITFKGTTKYVPEGVKMGAVGFNGEEFEAVEGISLSVKPEKIRASFVIDGAEVSSVGARVGTAPVAEATVEMKAGKAQTLSGDALTYSSEDAETYKGKTNVLVSGGTVESVRGVASALHKGNVTIGISEADAVTAPTTISEIKVNYGAEIAGNSYLTIAGGTILGDVVGGGANLTTYNTISGGTIKGSFYGIGEQSAKKIVNKISGGTFEGTVYGGSYGVSYIRGIENTITGGTFNDAFFGGSRSGSVDGNIKNNVSAGKFTNKNTVVDKSTYPTEVLQPGFAGGNRTGTVNGNIVNTITGGTFTKSYSGSGLGNVNGNVTNTLSGPVTLSNAFFGGSSMLLPTHITGQITNTIKSFESQQPSINQSGTYTSGFGVAYIGASGSGTVEGGVVNVIESGSFGTRFFGGGVQSAEGLYLGINEYGHSVTNFISGGTFSNVSHGGSLASDGTGDVYTEISGGTFKSSFAGGFRASNASHDKKVILKISGGTFNAAVYGATYGLNSDQQTKAVNEVEFHISGGTFNAAVYAGGRGKTPITNGATLLITGGTFNGSVVAGSETKAAGASTLIVEAKDADVTFAASIVIRSDGGKAILLGAEKAILLGTEASLTFDEYDGAAQKVTLTEAATPDHTYLSVPAAQASGITFEGDATETNGEWKKTIA